MNTWKLKHDFQSKNPTGEEWYDLREDWVLIESSLAKQYGIRIRKELDMPWTEFCNLVGGLMPDTPLGQIVGIRSEKNMETIRSFSTDQDRIYSEWQNRMALKKLDNTEKLNQDMDELASMFNSMFGSGPINTEVEVVRE